jgi:23S rRNA U2552 (ribose-2'-O)-methylase RlmE/FtsJ
MAIESFLSISSFAISLGGLVAALVVKSRKEVVLTVIVVALLVTTGITLYDHYQHESLIDRVQEEIVAELSDGPKTFDQIFQGVFFKSFTTVNEALFRAVEEGLVGHEFLELQVAGKPVLTRRYFLPEKPR